MPVGPRLYRPIVVVATMLTPLLGGAVIYHSVRKSHPGTADFANSMSALGFLAWGFLIWGWDHEHSRVVLGVLGAVGMIATDLAIRLIRRSPPEQTATSDAEERAASRGT